MPKSYVLNLNSISCPKDLKKNISKLKTIKKINLNNYIEEEEEEAFVTIIKDGGKQILGEKFKEFDASKKMSSELMKFTKNKISSLFGISELNYKLENCIKSSYKGTLNKKIIIGLYIGESLFFYFSWFKDDKPIGKTCRFKLNHGDIYILTDKSLGCDFRKKNIPILKHCIGCPEKPINKKPINKKPVDKNTKDEIIVNINYEEMCKVINSKDNVVENLNFDEYSEKQYKDKVIKEFADSLPAINKKMPNNYEKWSDVYMTLNVCKNPKKTFELGAKVDTVYDIESESIDKNDRYICSITKNKKGTIIACQTKYLNAHVKLEYRYADFIFDDKSKRWFKKMECECSQYIYKNVCLKNLNIKNLRVNSCSFKPNFSY